jgi:hypothetical protein
MARPSLLSCCTIALITDMQAQSSEMDRRIAAFDDKFKAHARINHAHFSPPSWHWASYYDCVGRYSWDTRTCDAAKTWRPG